MLLSADGQTAIKALNFDSGSKNAGKTKLFEKLSVILEIFGGIESKANYLAAIEKLKEEFGSGADVTALIAKLDLSVTPNVSGNIEGHMVQIGSSDSFILNGKPVMLAVPKSTTAPASSQMKPADFYALQATILADDGIDIYQFMNMSMYTGRVHVGASSKVIKFFVSTLMSQQEYLLHHFSVDQFTFDSGVVDRSPLEMMDSLASKMHVQGMAEANPVDIIIHNAGFDANNRVADVTMLMHNYGAVAVRKFQIEFATTYARQLEADFIAEANNVNFKDPSILDKDPQEQYTGDDFENLLIKDDSK